MPDQPLFDLAQPDAWFGFHPGMTRTEVLAGLEKRALGKDGDGEQNFSVTVDEVELEFWFATDGSARVRQISAEAAEIFWHGKNLLDERVDDALRTMEPHGPALWVAHDIVAFPFPEQKPAATTPPAPPTDDELLERSTVWLPEHGLGLAIYEGVVMGVAWRGPQDFPTQFAGPVTAAQRELSRRPDLEEYLREKRIVQNHVERRRGPLDYVRGALTVATVVVVAMIARRGFHDTQMWAQAPVLPGKLLAFERGPKKEFREYLPPPLPRLIPAGRPVETDLYRVEFQDPAGARREAVLEPSEFYVPPREVGEEVQVIYAAGEPPRVHGPSRARDAAFIDYVPWVICVGVLWLAGHIFLSLLPHLWPLLRRLVPQATVSDPDRPELR